MSKVFMLSTNTATDPYPVYPLGIAIVSSGLAAAGHEVRQFDFLAEGGSEVRLGNAITEFNPDFVGISLRNIDTVDSCNPENMWFLKMDRQLTGLVRRHTEAPVILGGPAFSIMPEMILDYLGADYGIVGEGEYLICTLVKSLVECRPMPTILSGTGSYCSSNGMQRPLWERKTIDYYLHRTDMLSCQTKRGCPYGCTYCTYPNIEGDEFRYLPVGDVIDEIEHLKKDYSVGSVFFTDAVFNDDKGRYLELAEGLLRQEIGIRWSAFFRPDGIDSKQLALLKRSGLYAVESGADATSDATLSELGKGFLFEDVYDFNRACIKEEIPCAHYVMFGGPGETKRSLKEGLGNLSKLEKCVIFAFSGIRIFPGTRLHQRAIEEGALAEEASLLMPTYYFSSAIDAKSMNNTIKNAFRTKNDRFFPPSTANDKMKVMNRLGFRGLLWDRLVSY